MRKQKRNKVKYDIDKITRVKSNRKMTVQEALKFAIRNGSAMADNIQEWIDLNKDDESYVLAQHADGVYTHLYCETDENEPFAVIFHKLNTNLDGVIQSTMDEIKLIKASVIPSSIQEGLELTILSTMFIQKDRMETFKDSVAKYRDVLDMENKNGDS